MSSERWERTKEILEEALRRASDQRQAYLELACGTDRELRAEVQSLIASHEEAGSQFMAAAAPELLQLSSSSNSRKAQENQDRKFIGPYRLETQLGEGGMGQVWLAEQTAPIKRQVALKLIKGGMFDSPTLQRFQSERQSLALMDHPAIAKVFDAGATPDGQPYFVMEYVPGVPLTDYCDQKRLKIPERLELFIKVCEGVQHAHQKAIIHRDLKPANILVVEVDGKPLPRIIDFGLAKGANREVLGEAQFTLAGSFLGTPGYISPEQADPGLQDVDTRTDVYSLGVVLYVSLTGSLPFETQRGRKQPLDQALRQLREDDPPRPSTRVGTQTETSQATAEARGTEPNQLVSLLRGDLDCITMKALEKDRARRYGTAMELATDIKRYLTHEPVLARPASTAYRTAKFVRRNRTVVALTAAAVVLVIGSLSTGLYVANRQRKVAEHRFMQVRELANKFIALDNDLRGLPGSTKVRMQIVSDSSQYLTSLGSDVHGDKDLALEIAYAYVRVAHAQGDPTSPNLGQFAEAEVSLNNAAGFADTVLAENPVNQRGLFVAATIAHDRMVLANSQGDHAEALKYAASAASLIERFINTHPTESHDLYSMRYFYSNVAGVYYDARRFNDATRYCQLGLDIPLSNNKGNGFTLTILAAARWQSGDLDGALGTSLDAIELEKGEAADGHASMRINLANGYDLEGEILGRADAEPSLGRTREALADFQKALDIAEDLAKKDANDYLGRHNVATVSPEIGNILRHRSPQDSLAVYDHALARIREARSNVSTQRDEAELLAASSYAVRWAGRDKEAKQRIARALELLNQAGRYPSDKVEPMGDAYDALRAQGDDYAETGHANKAIEAYQELLDKLMAWKPDVQNDLRDATCISRTWTALANMLRRTGRTEEAVRLEAQRTELWNHWNGKLPNAQFLLRQSLSQIAPRVVVEKR